MKAADWTDTACWYAIYPLGMVGAPMLATHPAQPEHRLGQLEAWLDHLISLGCNGLLLGPIFASRTHGYDTLDHFQIDPRLGDDADFDHLVQACRNKGIRLLLDGVFNHVSAEYPALLEALASPDAATSGWFHIDYSATPPIRLNFEGSDDLVRLNHDNPDVEQLVVDVMVHWLARGIDGWRLDAAYAVPPAFWAKVLGRVREKYPEALFVGEVIHADLAEVEASTLESITAYELWKATWSAISETNLFELDWTLGRHNQFLDLVRPLTFVSNHDVSRITSQLSAPGSVLAFCVLATVGGMPSIYYGDEGGMSGVKYERPGGDDEIRPAMPATADQWHPPYPWLVDQYRELLALRRRHPWLVAARTESLAVENPRLTYKVSAGEEWLQVTLDISQGYRAVVSGPEGEIFRFEHDAEPSSTLPQDSREAGSQGMDSRVE